MRRVCIVEDAEPHSFCTDNTPLGSDYVVWQKVAALASIAYNTTCMVFDSVLESIRNGTCDVGLGAISATVNRYREGFVFSKPYYISGVSILSRKQTHFDGFGWLLPLTWQLWLLLCATLSLFPLVLWYIEPSGKGIHWYRESTWSFLGDRIDVTMPPSMFLMLIFGFFSIIFTAIYTADLASVLIERRLDSGAIQTAGELRGRTVATYSEYMNTLALYGVNAVPLGPTWEDLTSAAEKVLHNHGMDAIVADQAFLLEVLSRMMNDTCSSLMLSDSFLFPIEYSFAAFQGGSAALLMQTNVSQAITQLSEDGFLESLYSNLFEGFPCASSPGGSGVMIQDVWGLFAILGGGILVSMSWSVYVKWNVRRAAVS